VSIFVKSLPCRRVLSIFVRFSSSLLLPLLRGTQPVVAPKPASHDFCFLLSLIIAGPAVYRGPDCVRLFLPATLARLFFVTASRSQVCAVMRCFHFGPSLSYVPLGSPSPPHPTRRLPAALNGRLVVPSPLPGP